MSGQFHDFAVDGFRLTGVDDQGCDWAVESAQGWFTGGSVRSATEARMQQNGDRRGRQYRGGRIVTLRGDVKAPNTVALEHAGRRLSAVLADGGFGLLVGDSPAGVLSSVVQVDDVPLFDPAGDVYATWQLTVGSEDPLLYGPPELASAGLAGAVIGTGRVWPRVWPRDWGVAPGPPPGQVTLSNVGLASYFPTLQIDGPVTNPVVSMVETGDRIAFRGAVPAGQFLHIDCARRRVIIAARSNPNAGVSMRHLTSSVGAWLAVPVGGATLQWTADDANQDASLSISSFEGAWP